MDKKIKTVHSLDMKKSDRQPYIFLVIDDDDTVLNLTKEVFSDFSYNARSLQVETAYSISEGKELYDEYPDAAIVLFNFEIETNSAGLDLINYIRNDNNNHEVQIVLRTGHEDFDSERGILLDYAVNAYLSRNELSSTMFYHSVIVFLRNYENLKLAHEQKKEIRRMNDKLSERNGELLAQTDLIRSFFSLASNSLSTPITRIRSALDSILEEDEDLSKKQLRHLNIISENNGFSRQLVHTLFDDTTRKLYRNELSLRVKKFSFYECFREYMPELVTKLAFIDPEATIDIKETNFDMGLYGTGDPNRIKFSISTILNYLAGEIQGASFHLNCLACDHNANLALSCEKTLSASTLNKFKEAFETSASYGDYEGLPPELYTVKRILDLHQKQLGVEQNVRGLRVYIPVSIESDD